MTLYMYKTCMYMTLYMYKTKYTAREHSISLHRKHIHTWLNVADLTLAQTGSCHERIALTGVDHRKKKFRRSKRRAFDVPGPHAR
jgi:hypothetical protein